jgi:hypothetical protein
MAAMSAGTVCHLYALGAALLAFWLLVRFPGLGPKRLVPAIGISIGAMLLKPAFLFLLGSVRDSAGPAAALMAVGLPLLTMLFWTSGCLVRAAVGARR